MMRAKEGWMKIWPFKKKSPPIPIKPPRLGPDGPFPPGEYTLEQLHAEAARWGLKFVGIVESSKLYTIRVITNGQPDRHIICEGELKQPADSKPATPKQDWVM
jgi:hypothetical protein